MIVTPIKTDIISESESLENVLDKYILNLEENTVIAITSKIVSYCEKNVIPISNIDKNKLIKDTADYLLFPPEKSKYGISLTIKNGTLIPNSGIDESNGNGNYILWPTNPYRSAQNAWIFLKTKFNLKNIGIIITDSTTSPLRWGTRGICIGYCGIKPLNNYIGKPDLFGHNLQVTKASIIDGLAASAVLVMGEGNENTPICSLTQLTNVEFNIEPPSVEEQKSLIISPVDDLYAPLLNNI